MKSYVHLVLLSIFVNTKTPEEGKDDSLRIMDDKFGEHSSGLSGDDSGDHPTQSFSIDGNLKMRRIETFVYA